MFNKKMIFLVGILVIAVIASGAGFAYIKISEKEKDKVQRAIVNKYLGSYRKPNVAALREIVSEDMKTALPGDQKAFKKQVERSNKANGKIKDWKIISSDANEYVGQTVVDVTINTSKKTYSVMFDMVGSDKNGWKIRAVKENAGSAPSANMGGMGQTAPGSHGMQ